MWCFYRFDPSNLKGGLKKLYDDMAASPKVKDFLQQAKDYEVTWYLMYLKENSFLKILNEISDILSVDLWLTFCGTYNCGKWNNLQDTYICYKPPSVC